MLIKVFDENLSSYKDFHDSSSNISHDDFFENSIPIIFSKLWEYPDLIDHFFEFIEQHAGNPRNNWIDNVIYFIQCHIENIKNYFEDELFDIKAYYFWKDKMHWDLVFLEDSPLQKNIYETSRFIKKQPDDYDTFLESKQENPEIFFIYKDLCEKEFFQDNKKLLDDIIQFSETCSSNCFTYISSVLSCFHPMIQKDPTTLMDICMDLRELHNSIPDGWSKWYLGNTFHELSYFLWNSPQSWEKIKAYISKNINNKRVFSVFKKGVSQFHTEHNFLLLFKYLIHHSPKKIYTVFNSLLSANDIWVTMELLKSININLWKDIDFQELIETGKRLKIDKREQQRLESAVKTWKRTQENKLSESQKIARNTIVKILWSWFNNYLIEFIHHKTKVKISSILDLRDIDITNEHLEDILQNQDFIDVFKMFQWTTINKENFKNILLSYIDSITSDSKRWFPYKNKENISWCNKQGIDINKLNSKHRKTYKIKKEKTQEDWQINKINDFYIIWCSKIDEFNKILPYWVEALKDANSAWLLVLEFNTVIQKREAELKKIDENLYEDLKLQIRSIEKLLSNKKSKEITHISIEQELNPLQISLMWNKVDGSCLDYYSNIKNYWSCATNAVDINKPVFFIYDQDWVFIARVLCAIDNDKKIMRFPVYTKGNINTDLNPYMNTYIKEFAKTIWLWLWGDITNVEQILGEEWYEDPVIEIYE